LYKFLKLYITKLYSICFFNFLSDLRLAHEDR